MRGYLVYEVEVTDSALWAEYRKVAVPLVEAAGGRFIIHSEKVHCLEGDWQPASVVVVEFPSFDVAKEFFESAAYQEVMPLRIRASRGRGVLVGSSV